MYYLYNIYIYVCISGLLPCKIHKLQAGAVQKSALPLPCGQVSKLQWPSLSLQNIFKDLIDHLLSWDRLIARRVETPEPRVLRSFLIAVTTENGRNQARLLGRAYISGLVC